MFKNYIIAALRNLKRHKVFSAINILGLAGSMAVFILITIYVRLIAGTDKFHEHADRIYRVERPGIHNLSAPVGPFLMDQYPEVEGYLRMGDSHSTSNLIKFNDKTIRLNHVWLVDSTFFTMLSFPLVYGTPNSVLKNPNDLVLTQSAANRLFGHENPVGKSVIYENVHILQVAGVMNDFPVNSSIQGDAVIAFDFYKTLHHDPAVLESFKRWNYSTLLRLNPETDFDKLTKNINNDIVEFLVRNNAISNELKPVFLLTPLTEIFFSTYENHDNFKHGSRSNITISIGVSIIILILAIINFTNLSTAQATYRVKEIGIRKTLGAGKPVLIKQHLLECITTAYISILFAVILVEQLIHIFSSMVNIELYFSIFDDINMAIILIGPLVLGTLAGSYPAFFISSFSPKAILSGEQTGGQKGSLFRKILTISQFAAATVLIIFTLHVDRQVNYLINKNLGIDKENRIMLETSPEMLKNREAFMNELKANPIIKNATLHGSPLGRINEGWGMQYQGQGMNYRVQLADTNYFSTLNVKILEGRKFKSLEPGDSLWEVVINEQAVRQYNLEDPIGIVINVMPGMTVKIVGVINDFHFESLHKPIEPLMIVNRIFPQLLTVYYQPGQTQEAIRHIEGLWKEFSPNSPLTYNMVSDELAKLYQEESRLRNLFKGFTVVAIFIACIGMFGLATFDIGKRIREIGIRKVLGSTSAKVISFITLQFLRTVAVSIAFAFPVSYWLIKKWLQNFITPAGHSIVLYFGSGLLVVLITLLTVIYHSYKAANTNPASVLKYE